MDCCEDYERLARHCVEREGELARYKRLSYEYLEEIKRLVLLLSSALSYLRTAANGARIDEEVLKRLQEELRHYSDRYLFNRSPTEE